MLPAGGSYATQTRGQERDAESGSASGIWVEATLPKPLPLDGQVSADREIKRLLNLVGKPAH